MTSDEMQFQLERLIGFLATAMQAQSLQCHHRHHCHRVGELSEAEGVASDLKRELELQEAERVVEMANEAAAKRAA